MVDKKKEAENIVCQSSEEKSVAMGRVVSGVNLNVRSEPVKSPDNVVSEIQGGTIVMVDEAQSTQEWLKVYTEAGAEGFCMREFIDIMG